VSAEQEAETLESIQEKFAAALLAPAQSPAALALFQGEAAQNTHRLALYRGNLGEHWEKALAGAYPVLQMQLGDEFFFAMARVYGRQYPSDCGDLNRFGAHMPAFLEAFAPVQEYPWLPDLARLEWALHRAHYAADAEPFDTACIATLTPESMDTLYLELQSACTVLRLQWDVVTLWQAHQQEPQGEWQQNLRMPITALVYRAGWRTDLRILDAAEATGITNMATGAPVGDILDAVLAQDPARDIGGLFARWLGDNILRRPA
jgi:hypothetical protein